MPNYVALDFSRKAAENGQVINCAFVRNPEPDTFPTLTTSSGDLDLEKVQAEIQPATSRYFFVKRDFRQLTALRFRPEIQI